MEIAEYKPGDEMEICAWLGGRTIAEASAVERVTPEIWRWRFTKSPHGDGPRAFVARHQGELVAHAAAVPSAMWIGGSVHRAAHVFYDGVTPEQFVPLQGALLERLRPDSFDLVYALVTEEELPRYRDLEFVPLFEVHARNMYLGLSGVSRRLDKRLQTVRKFAQKAISLRPKLVEVAFDDGNIAQAARLFSFDRQSDPGEQPELSLERSEKWIRWRYGEKPGKQFRLLQLRRKAGAIDAVAIVRLFEYEPGRMFIQLVDHATREIGRRATAWLLGEVAMFGLSEKADVLQAFAASGSELDQALLGSGCIRKKRQRIFVARWLSSESPSPLVSPFPTKHVDLCAGAVEL